MGWVSGASRIYNLSAQQLSEGRDYKAVSLQQQGLTAFCHKYEELVDCTKRQPLPDTITCVNCDEIKSQNLVNYLD
ncbi:hypothetical protein [Microcoleus sp. herbarium12]|uniref:hypothetical protein n=1 Tax=Microcoleus sp. herbarium12 TaxID=3055437 RepID=UPI002FD1C237